MKLEAKDIVVRYSGVVALDTVSVGCRTGEILGVIGPNGSGKSTLVNVLSGFRRPASGCVTIDGVELRPGSTVDAVRAGVVRTFQTVKLFPETSALEQVALTDERLWHGEWWRGLRLRQGGRWRQAREHAARCLSRAGVESALWSRPVGVLSYGDQRRVELARAIGLGPSFLLLDEPAAGMGEAESAAIGELLTTLASDGIGILIIEHDLDLVARYCDSLVVLATGKVLEAGKPREVLAGEVVISVYSGKVAQR